MFTILDKAKVHTSATYGEPMPNMERLTWDGIALHVGNLPGYPDFAWLRAPADGLRRRALRRHPNRHAGDHRRRGADPSSVYDPGPLLGTTAEDELGQGSGGKPVPSSRSNAVTSILVSRGDMRISIYVHAIVAEGNAMIEDPSEPLGSKCLRVAGGDADGSTWQAIGYHAGPSVPTAPTPTCFERIDRRARRDGRDQGWRQAGHGAGDHRSSASPETRSGSGFTVMDAPTS